MIKTTFALLIGLAACGGTDSLPAGAACTAGQGTPCESGLTCLDLALFSGSACTVVGASCSLVCTGNADCASLGSNFMCFAGCGSAMTCGEVAQ
jgi:hypothetical protein